MNEFKIVILLIMAGVGIFFGFMNLYFWYKQERNSNKKRKDKNG